VTARAIQYEQISSNHVSSFGEIKSITEVLIDEQKG
jgi:hypothetical protein